MDNLEKYILDNRGAFDTEMPDVVLWQGIESRLSDEGTLDKFIQDNRTDFDSETPRLDLWAGIESRLIKEDSVEKFVLENKGDFDTEIPNLKVWSNIEKQLPNPLKQVSELKTLRFTWFRLAAAAVGLLVFGVMIGLFINSKQEEKVLAVAKEIAPELSETEQFYNKKIETKLTQYAGFSQDPSVLADLKQVDEVQAELRKELQNAPTSTREEIVKRLIENYQIKLGILERVLNNINEHQSDNLKKSQQQHESI
jgi:hypothetical protein